MIKIKQAVIVEGKYDKIKLSNIIDAPIIQTDGFGIFKDKELQLLIRTLAKKRGILVLTDSDSAGFKIRSFIGSTVDKNDIINAYIPDIFGKEKRKEKPSSEGKLGVEGIEKKLIIEAFKKAGITFDDAEQMPPTDPITRADLFELGLTGGTGSSERRRKLLKSLDLPEKLSTTGMLEILNTTLSKEELVKKINQTDIES